MGDIASEARNTLSISHSCSLAALVTNIVPKIYITMIKAINVSIFSFFCRYKDTKKSLTEMVGDSQFVAHDVQQWVRCRPAATLFN